jgi:hypothetical protein
MPLTSVTPNYQQFISVIIADSSGLRTLYITTVPYVDSIFLDDVSIARVDNNCVC